MDGEVDVMNNKNIVSFTDFLRNFDMGKLKDCYYRGEDGHIYWEWRNGAKNALKNIIEIVDRRINLYPTPCYHYSDKLYIERLREAIKCYFGWLGEIKEPHLHHAIGKCGKIMF